MLKNANIIGGGVAQNARIIIDSCFFDNGVDGSVTVRYHNVDLPDAKGDIWISNSFFNGFLAMCYYGGSAHIDVYVNGCRAVAVERRKETPDSFIQNIDLYEWNNETYPVALVNDSNKKPLLIGANNGITIAKYRNTTNQRRFSH